MNMLKSTSLGKASSVLLSWAECFVEQPDRQLKYLAKLCEFSRRKFVKRYRVASKNDY